MSWLSEKGSRFELSKGVRSVMNYNSFLNSVRFPIFTIKSKYKND